MKKVLILLMAIGLMSCGKTEPQTTSNPDSPEIEVTEAEVPEEGTEVSEVDPQTALDFINGYIANILRMAESEDILVWTQNNQDCTQELKDALKKMMDEADPEYGLGFDPILDAQDFPEEGFKLLTQNGNIVTVEGIDIPGFTVNLKMAKTEAGWKVNGCGVVNMAENERAVR